MFQSVSERILLIGDTDRQILAALTEAAPSAQIKSVGDVFDGIAELTAAPFTAVLLAAEPIERRPEAAVKTLRQLAAGARLLLFGHPTLEPLSQKMLAFGCDDYLISPTTSGELQQMLSIPPTAKPATKPAPPPPAIASAVVEASTRSIFDSLALDEIFLNALLKNAAEAVTAAVAQINSRLMPPYQLHYGPASSAPPETAGDAARLTQIIRGDGGGGEPIGLLQLQIDPADDPGAAGKFLDRLAQLIGKLAALQDRQARLQRLALTDDLTGIFNGRYFRHFLARIIEKARVLQFPVTLCLFDIDNFKRYNDQYGHGMGDEILRQTAALMRRSCRDHDLVARISGDEFAVVFWEKEGPRQPRDSRPGIPGRPPKEPEQILRRFQKLLESQTFSGLGPAGKGTLTISASLANFPYHAQDATSLIEVADKGLMFGAKRLGKNSIYLVGTADETETDLKND